MIRVSGAGVDSYPAFKAFVDAFGAREADVVYKTDGTSFFIVAAQIGDVSIESNISGGKPATFDADFSQAVQVDANTAIAVI